MSNIRGFAKISIWHPSSLQQNFIDTGSNTLVDTSSFYECIYSLELPQSTLNSITCNKRSDALRDALNIQLSDDLTSNKTVQDFDRLIKLVDDILGENVSSWISTEQEEKLKNGDAITLRQHQLLSLRHHLQWIYDTFCHLPGIAISIR
ncbi:hypothetical protein [Gloeobacter kilaueensis]|uniref:hypothetical protein n=1 Tax=Gloeobacter kilaueensis TaxID=1416614 RepID=UPI00118285EF|nr:hypothetical protein [Gloeobacter kilaueensis]